MTSTQARRDVAEIFSTWRTWRRLAAPQLVEARLVEDAAGVARVNDNSSKRTIADAGRAVLLGQRYAVVRVGLYDRGGGFIETTLARKIGRRMRQFQFQMSANDKTPPLI